MTAFIEDRVLPDRIIGQYDIGWVIYDDSSNEDDVDAPCWFLSDDGIVYDYGTSDAVGKCEVAKQEFNEYIKEIEELGKMVDSYEEGWTF